MSDVNPIPAGFHSVSAYLIVSSAAEALAFYAKAFGAEEVSRMPGPAPGSIMHAEMRVGDCRVMLSDENPQFNAQSPKTLGGTPVSLHLYVEDADAAFGRAVTAGCEVQFPIDDTFWGDRYGKVVDPFGHIWGIATRKLNLTPEEMATRQAEAMKAMAEGGSC